MTKPVLLDLYCCAGGATRGYQQAGFTVVGVDIKRRRDYCGDDFFEGDAIDYVTRFGHLYDGIHTSPPCQERCTLTNGTNDDVPCSSYCAERVEVRQGNVVTEFLYSNYGDLNEPLNKIDAWYPAHIVEKRDGQTMLDLTIVETETGNPYVVMPVPPSVKRAAVR